MSDPVTSPDGTSSVSAVIVSWNSRAVLIDCIRALRKHPPSGTLDLVVVDNGSSDGTVQALRREAPWVRVIANAKNRGLPAANNQGIAATTGRYVLIANPDTQVGPDALDALVDALDRHPRAAFAVPRLHNADGTLQTSTGDLPTLREALLGRQAQRRSSKETGFWWDGWTHDEERAVGRGHEACYLVRRDAIVDIGLQDESFVLDWEGIDWTRRAHERGWEVWFTPAADVLHIGGASIRQVPARWIAGSHYGMYRYFAKRTRFVLRPLLAAAVAFRGLAKLVGAMAGLAGYERGQAGPAQSSSNPAAARPPRPK